MSVSRKALKLEREELEKEAQLKDVRMKEADALMQQTLEVVNDGLRVKREVRSRAAQFNYSFRPSSKARG